MRKIDFLCFGGGDWWYHNRGHIDMQLMRRFAKLGTTVYVNSVVVQKPVLRHGKKFFEKVIRKTKSICRGLQKSDAGFWVYSPCSLPVHHIAWVRHLNTRLLQLQVLWVTRKLGMTNPVVWLTCPAATDLALTIKKNKLVYQRADRWEEFPNVDKTVVLRYDRKAKSEADLTIFVNRMLYEEEHEQCKNALYLDHGVDYKKFAMVSNSRDIPIDMRDIESPTVGFFGGIDDHTFDVDFVEKVIDMLPQMSFVFVGSTSADVTELQKRKNVWLLGQKPYEQIPHYGKCFDVAIMPWRQNQWIEACNPVKLKEYLALGKPVVSTPFAELQKYRDVVYEAKTPGEFAKCIRKALAEDNPVRVAARRKIVEVDSWESKAQLVLQELFGKACDYQESNLTVRRMDKSIRPEKNGIVRSSKWRSVNLLGIDVSAIRAHEVVDIANEHIANRKKLLIGVINVAKIISMRKDPELRSSLEGADLILADGVPIVWLSRMLGEPLPERVTGIDIMYKLLQQANESHYRVYFLGAKPEVLRKVIRTMQRDYPGIRIAGYRDGYFDKAQERSVAEGIRNSKADIFFVAISSPKKEKFLRKWRDFINVPVCHGVGGSFDILAGVSKRAPLWMQKSGLEWLYRLIQEPRRMWKRYLINNTIFIILSLGAIIQARFSRLFRRFTLKPASNTKSQNK